MGRSTLDLVVGITLIVIGALMVIGKFGLGDFIGYLGIILIVVGILILIGKLPGGTLIGIVALVVGIILAAGIIGIPGISKEVVGLVNLVLGIVLIVLGVKRLL